MSTYTDLIDDIEPKSSDDIIIASVLEKNRIIKRKKIRNLSVSAFVLTIFMAMTITVGAVNDWDYTAVLRGIFNDNPIVADSMENDINFRVVNNTYDGITFDLTGLHADNESLFLVVDINSETPRFIEPLGIIGGSALQPLILAPESSGSELLYVNSPERVGFTMGDYRYYVIDETRMIAVIYLGESIQSVDPDIYVSYVHPFHEAVASGREFILLIGEISLDDGPDYSGLYLSGGSAELRFTVDEIDDKNVLLVNPHLPLGKDSLGNDAFLREIRITPFSMILRFDGLTGYVGKNVSLLMKDGGIIPLDHISHGFGIGYFTDYENHSWATGFHHNKLLDLDEIVAVIFNGTEIPIG